MTKFHVQHLYPTVIPLFLNTFIDKEQVPSSVGGQVYFSHGLCRDDLCPSVTCINWFYSFPPEHKVFPVKVAQSSENHHQLCPRPFLYWVKHSWIPFLVLRSFIIHPHGQVFLNRSQYVCLFRVWYLESNILQL